MANIYTPKSNKEFFAPFGPTMAYCQLSADLVTFLNTKMVEQLDELEDFSDHLVGKVHQELAWSEEIKERVMSELSNFIAGCVAWSHQRTHAWTEKLDMDKYDYGIQVMSAWYVRQFAHEYNPLHLHTSCRISCVGYLALPEKYEEECEEDYKDHHPSHGHLQFASGTTGNWNTTNFMVKPKVGDFWLFPAELFHMVYPFSSEGERRSFSINMNFLEMTKEAAEKAKKDGAQVVDIYQDKGMKII